jgi:glutamine amidotransferase
VIALVDYGAGNLASVRKALRAVGAAFFTPTAPAELARAGGVIVPGVGHFASTAALDAEWRAALADGISRGTPYLGICLGMQWLFEGSDEAPDLQGLAILPGRITRLPEHEGDGTRIKVPHVGWNRVHWANGPELSPDIPDGEYFYFTHAYAAPVTADCVGYSDYGVRFASAVRRSHVWGVQFHPEKSGSTGLAILDAYLTFVSASRQVRQGGVS